jgi:predicted acyltransferase
VEAVRAVVAVFAGCTVRNDQPTTIAAGELLGAGMGLIIAFFEGFSLVFPIHRNLPNLIYNILSCNIILRNRQFFEKYKKVLACVNSVEYNSKKGRRIFYDC